jgi:N6-adenosine-specific RNA methylase IME4
MKNAPVVVGPGQAERVVDLSPTLVVSSRQPAFSNSLADLIGRAEIEHDAASGHMVTALDHAIASGQILLEAKAQVERGEWLPLLRARCRIPERTCQLYMKLAVHAEELKSATVADSVRGAVDFLAMKKREASVTLMLERRELREVELAGAAREASEALGKKLYGVIYADPPWRFETYGPAGQLMTSPENHYPCMDVEQIKALKIPAADDCVLFLWAVIPMLPEACAVMAAWGFTYKSAYIWRKESPGIGYWAQSECEMLLIGTRGKVPGPGPGNQPPQVIEAPRGRHSEKPAVFAEHIARLYPNTPKLEMFAREPRPGWDVHGNEVEL